MIFGEDIRQLKESHGQLGSGRFWLIMVGTVAFILVGGTLIFMANWPTDCEPGGRDLIGTYRCSPRLLSGNAVDMAAAVWLWSIPTIGVVVVTWSWINHFRRKRARTTQWSK